MEEWYLALAQGNSIVGGIIMSTEYDAWLWSAITVLNRKKVFDIHNYNIYKANSETVWNRYILWKKPM